MSEFLRALYTLVMVWGLLSIATALQAIGTTLRLIAHLLGGPQP